MGTGYHRLAPDAWIGAQAFAVTRPPRQKPADRNDHQLISGPSLECNDVHGRLPLGLERLIAPSGERCRTTATQLEEACDQKELDPAISPFVQIAVQCAGS